MKQLLTILRSEQRIPGFRAASRLLAVAVMCVTSNLAFADITLNVEKVASQSVVPSGESVTYTYSITNLQTPGSGSDGRVKNVRLVDTFNRRDAIDAIVGVDDDNDWDCDDAPVSSGNITTIGCDWEGGVLEDNGQDITLEIKVVPAAVNSPTTLANTAEVTADPVDDDGEDGEVFETSDEVTVQLIPSARLDIERTGLSELEVDAEQTFDWTLEVTNHGPSRASNLKLEENFPEGIEIDSIDNGDWDCVINQPGHRLVCELDKLELDETEGVGVSELTVHARAPRNPSEPGKARAVSDFGEARLTATGTHIADASNNTIDEGEDNLTVVARWDLSLSKAASVEEVAPEQEFGYSIEITNAGPSDMTGDIRPLLNDVLDDSLKGVSGVCPGSRPCWFCTWDQSPNRMAGIDSDDHHELGGAWPLAMAPNGSKLVVGGSIDNLLVELDRETTRGAEFGQIEPADFGTASMQARVLAMHPGGDWLAAAGDGGSGDELGLFSFGGAGIEGPEAVQQIFDTVSALVFSPDGRNLFVADSAAGQIRQFAVDVNGQEPVLQPKSTAEHDESVTPQVLLAGVAGMAISPDGKYLYAAVPDEHVVTVFEIEESGEFGPVESYPLENSAGGIAAVTIVAGHDRVYAGGGQTIVEFERAAAGGTLGDKREFVAGSGTAPRIKGVNDLALSMDGRVLVASSAGSDKSVSLFRRLPGEEMAFVHSSALPDKLRPNAVVVDGNGEHLYVTATSSPVDGTQDPESSAVLAYSLAGPASCDVPDQNQMGSGDIDDVALELPAGQTMTVIIAATVKSGTPNGVKIDNQATLTEPETGSGEPDKHHSENVKVVVRNLTGIFIDYDASETGTAVPGEDFHVAFDIKNSGPTGVDGLEVNGVLPLSIGTVDGFLDDTVEWACSATGNACCNPGYGEAQCGRQGEVTGVGLLSSHKVNVGIDGELHFSLGGRVHPEAGPSGQLDGEVQLVMPKDIEPVDEEHLHAAISAELEARADLVLIKESLGIDSSAGKPVVSYRIAVENHGPSAARGVGVEDPLSDDSLDDEGAGWTCEIADDGSGGEYGEDVLPDSCCDFNRQTSACENEVLGNASGPIAQDIALAPGARAVFEIDVPVADDGAAEVTNKATLSLPSGLVDPDLSNNTRELSTRVLTEADLKISKEILAADSVTPGNEVQFVITVTNDGPDGVPVVVEDIFEPYLDDIAWSCDATTPTPGDLTHNESLSRGLDSELDEGRDVLTSADGHHVYVLLAGRPGAEDKEKPAAIAVFERNIVPGPDFGALTLLETEVDGVDDPDDSGMRVEGLAGARAMALSPDQRHLYVAAADANAVTVFARKHIDGSEDFGELVFVESRAQDSSEPSDSITPATGLDGAADVAVSHDGKHVYVTGRRDNAVAIFARNDSTGALSFEGQVVAGDDGLENALWGASSIHVAPNDRDVYVSSAGLATFSGYGWRHDEYQSAPVHFLDGENSRELEWFSQVEPVAVPELDNDLELDNVDRLELEFDHRFSFDEDSDGCVDIGVVQYSNNGGRDWRDIDDSDDRFVQGGYTDTLDINAENPLAGARGWCGKSADFDTGFDSVVLDLTGLVEFGDSLALRFGFGRGNGGGEDSGWWIGDVRLVVIDGEDESETVLLDGPVPEAGQGQGSLVHFARQDDKAAIGFGGLSVAEDGVYSIDLIGSVEPRADFSHMDREAENIYVGGRDGTIVVYGRNADSGALAHEQTLVDLDGFNAQALDGLAALSTSLDGEHVVAAAAGSSSLVVFRRQPFVGILDAMQVLGAVAQGSGGIPLGINSVQGVVFSDDGQHVFSAGQDGSLGVFDRAAPDPTFNFLEAVFDGEDDGTGNDTIASGLLGARAATLSSNGRWLYVAGYGQVGSNQEGSLAILRRDSAAAERGHHLSFEKAFIDGRSGVSGMKGAIDVISLPVVAGEDGNDGNYEDIYVVSDDDSKVVHFRHEMVPGGNAEFVAAHDFGLSGPSAIAAQAEGEYVFVASRFNHKVVMLSRDSGGSLTPVASAEGENDGIQGLRGPVALAVSRDGAQLYVGAFESGSVVVLDIDGTAGSETLTWNQTVYDGSDGAKLASPSGIAVSNDGDGGAHVIVTSWDDNAVTVLRRMDDSTSPDRFGKLEFQQTLSNTTEGLEMLLSPRAVAIDPDNDRVYVAADGGNALIILGRNTSGSGSQFGQLQPLEVRQNNTGGIIGLNRPYGLAVSTGARRHIYLPSLGSQSVAAFARRGGSSCAGSGNGDLAEEVFIAADGTIRFTITATVDPGAEDIIKNEAQLKFEDDVINQGNPDDTSAKSEPLPLKPESALGITKTSARPSVVAGEREHYQIVVTNDGPSHARDVAVRDLLSNNPAFDESDAAWSCRAVGAGQLQREMTLVATAEATAALGGVSAMAWARQVVDEVLPARLYVTGQTGNGLAALSIDEATDTLAVDEVVAEGDEDVDGTVVNGLRGARNVTVSDDGKFVYVVSQVDNSLLVFEPELTDSQSDDYGRLRLLQTLSPDNGGPEMLDQPQGLALSHDGETVYVTGASSNTLHAFSRDSATGLLTLKQTIDAGDVPGLSGAVAVLTGPEDKHVYVAAAGSGAVQVFGVNGSGELEHMQSRTSPGIAGLVGAADLALSPDGRHLYVAGRDADAVVVLPRNNDDGSQSFGRLESPAQQLDSDRIPDLAGPRAVAVSADGGTVYVAAFETDTLLALRRDRNSGELSLIDRYKDLSDESGLGGLSSLAFSANHDMLFAGAVLDGAVTRFDRKGFSSCSVDSGSGDVEFDVNVAAGGEVIIDLSVGTRPEAQGESCPEPLDPGRQCVVNSASLAWEENGEVQSESAQTAGILGRAARLHIDKTDHLAEFRGLSDAVAVTGTDAGGGHVYVAAPGEPGLGVYELAPGSGPTGDAPLTFVQLVLNGEDSVSGLNGVSDVLVSPDGKHVYASSALDSSVVAFVRDADSGRLTWLARYKNNADGFAGLSGARALAMDSQGSHLYVAGANGNDVAVLARQGDSDSGDFGALTFQEMVQNGTDGVTDMLRPVHLGLSPDDAHLYVAATQSDAVVVLARDSDSSSESYGALTWQQSRRNLIGGVSGLLDVSRVLISASGKSLYAAGGGNNALVHFARDAGSASSQFGRLEFEQAYIDGTDGIEGLADVGALSLAGGNDSRLVAASKSGNAITLFERDTDDGSLQFASTLTNAPGLDGPAGLWTGPGGQRLYVAAGGDSALGVFDLTSSGLEPDGVMTQGGGGAVPGDEVTYEITVYNEGPSLVENARITDVFPDQFSAVKWSCQVVGADLSNSSCPNGEISGNVDAAVSLDVGASVIIEATGLLRPDAEGRLINEARVDMPAGITDLGGGNNVAVDDDTVINARSEVTVEFLNLPATAVAGAPFEFAIAVSNHGPAVMTGGRLALELPEALQLQDWMCLPDIEPGLLQPAESYDDGFAGARAGALSLDGQHVYVTGTTGSGDALLVFERNTMTGELGLLQTLNNHEPASGGAGEVDGLAGGADVLVSPDGVHVYVAGRSDDAVAVFERDMGTGELSFVDVIRDGVGAVDGLAGARSLAMDAAGRHLYVAGELDNGVAVLERDASTGALSFVQVRRNNQNGVERLESPAQLRLLDDDSRLWVVAADSDSIVRFERGADGRLEADGYFRQGGDDGGGSQIDGLAGIRSFDMRADGVLAVLSDDGSHATLTLYDRPGDHVIRQREQVADGDVIGTPPDTAGGLAGADRVVVDAHTGVIYIAGRGSANEQRVISAFVEDPTTSALQYLGTRTGGEGVDSPAALTLSNDGRQLYLFGGESIDLFDILAGSSCRRAGEEQLRDTIDLMADSRVVYQIEARVMANARGEFDLLAMLESSPAFSHPDQGDILAVENVPVEAHSGLEVTKTALTDPVVAGEDASWTFTVTNHGPSSIKAIEVSDYLPVLPGNQPKPGAPGAVAGSGQWQCEGLAPLMIEDVIGDGESTGLTAVAISDDGRWAAAVSPAGGRLQLFARDIASGALTLVDSLEDGAEVTDGNGLVVAETGGLTGATAAAFSHDGQYLYVVSGSGSSIAQFRVDGDEPGLEYVEMLGNGQGSVIGLDAPQHIVLSPDDERVYVAARGSSAVTVFRRNPVDGRLEWSQSLRSGIGLPLNVLDGVRDLVISPDGLHLYAAAAGHSAIVMFALNGQGDLSYLDYLANGDYQGGRTVVGLGLVQSLAVSPQGRHVYAASLSEDSITRFVRNADDGGLTWDDQVRNGYDVDIGLDGVSALVLSNDGEYLYAGSRNDGGVLVFERDWSTGGIEVIDRLDDPALPGVRRMVGDELSLLAAVDAGGGELVSLPRKPQSFCGGAAGSAVDDLTDVIDLAPGASIDYSMTALVHPGARGMFANTATAQLPAHVVALTPDEHSSTTESPIDVVTDLEIVKSIDGEASALVAGGPVRFLINVYNEGPSHALGARVLDELPAAVLDASWTCAAIPGDTAGTYCPASGSGDVDELVDILAGERMLLQLFGIVDPAFRGQLTNAAEVEAPLDGNDPDTDNNRSSVSSTVNVIADIYAEKSVSSPQAAPDELIEYTLVIGNDGPSDAPRVSVSDMTPAGMTFEFWTCSASQGSCPASGSGSIDEEIAVEAGGEAVFVVQARLDADLAVGETLLNEVAAALEGEGSDPESGNNSDAVEIEVVPAEADVQVSKTVDATSALPGDWLIWEVTVINAGPGLADRVQIIDEFPDSVLSATWTCDGFSGAVCQSSSGSGDLLMEAAMPAESVLVFVIEAQIDPGLPAGPDEHVINVAGAGIVGESIEVDDSNNSDSATTILDFDYLFNDRFEAGENNGGGGL